MNRSRSHAVNFFWKFRIEPTRIQRRNNSRCEWNLGLDFLHEVYLDFRLDSTKI